MSMQLAHLIKQLDYSRLQLLDESFRMPGFRFNATKSLEQCCLAQLAIKYLSDEDSVHAAFAEAQGADPRTKSIDYRSSDAPIILQQLLV